MVQTIARWLRQCQRGTITLMLAFFSSAAFMVASTQFNRHIAAWSYARHPTSYSLVDYKITLAFETYGPKGRGPYQWVKGQIGDREVEASVNRTAISADIFDQLKKGNVHDYETRVLYSPRFDKSDPDYPGHSSVHVVEPNVQGTTPFQVMLDIAAWNCVWLLGVVAIVANNFYERRQYRREMAACFAENERRRSRLKCHA